MDQEIRFDEEIPRWLLDVDDLYALIKKAVGLEQDCSNATIENTADFAMASVRFLSNIPPGFGLVVGRNSIHHSANKEGRNDANTAKPNWTHNRYNPCERPGVEAAGVVCQQDRRSE